MMRKSVGILLALLLAVLCFGASGEAAVSSGTVRLTVTPDTGLLMYQNVLYTINAKGAANDVVLVFVDGECEDEIYLDEFTQPDENGVWFVDFSAYYGGEIGVYAKASFDGGVTWVSSEMQTLCFEVKGQAYFEAVADSDVVAKGEPIVIRFSGMDMVDLISPPNVFKVAEDEDLVELPDFPDVLMNQSKMTCETVGLEAGTYRFVFFSMPAALGYAEYPVAVDVTVTE